MSFKAYLKEKGIEEKDLATGIQKLEELLGKAIAFVVPNTDTNIVRGLIWQNGKINTDTSPEDIERGLEILRQAVLRKRAQGLVDQFDAEEFQTQQPSAMKFNLTSEDTKLETGDPLDSQQIGKFQEIVPEKVMDEDPDAPRPPDSTLPIAPVPSMGVMGMDDRVYELLKISA